MKKISFLIAAIILFITCYNCANALMTTQQTNNVRKSYQIYKSKLRTCSPYTYNVDGDPAIVRIEGIYNRRCLVRFLSEANTIECSFKNDSLKKYLGSMLPVNQAVKNLEEVANAKGTETGDFSNAQLKHLLGNFDIKESGGVCKLNNNENQDNNNAQ